MAADPFYQFAEMYVAGQFAAAGWNVYFPHRDDGFDFIVSKLIANHRWLVRPVQVKGKYIRTKATRVAYGYVGRLSQIHPEMILAIPFFDHGDRSRPVCIAFIPRSQIRPTRRGYRCSPANFVEERTQPRRDYRKFFDSDGLNALESPAWRKATIGKA